LDALIEYAFWVEVNTQVTVCRDPKDDKFLSLAVSGGATYIVTGDKDLLALDPFQGIRILTPSDFLALL
jgi:putative PIN family toxin of toxin-antitoxin system